MTHRIAQLCLLTAAVLLPVLVFAADEASHDLPDPIVPQTVWAIISFCVVLAILWKKVLPLILGGMDRRASDIRDALSAAEKAKAEAEERMQRHQADLETARVDARKIIEEGKADAEKVRAQIVADAKRESLEISDRATRSIELAKQAALQDLHLQSVQLSFDLANDLIRKNLDPKDHQDLVDERIRGFQADS